MFWPQRDGRNDAGHSLTEVLEELWVRAQPPEYVREALHPLRRQPFPEVNRYGLRSCRW